MKKILLVLLIAAISAGQALADKKHAPESQKNDYKPQGVIFGIALDMTVPRGEYKMKNDNFGFGFDVIAAYHFSIVPIAIGLEFAYGSFGSKEYEFEDYDGYYYTSDFDFSISRGEIFLRFQPIETTVQPYFEAILGFSYLWAEEDLGFDDEYDEVDEYELFDDFTSNWGLGAGVMFPLFTTDNHAGLFLDAGVRYLFGGEAKYMTVSSDDINKPLITSTTNMFVFRLGVSLNI